MRLNGLQAMPVDPGSLHFPCSRILHRLEPTFQQTQLARRR